MAEDAYASAKIVLVGKSNTGKTALLIRYVDNVFSSDYVSTIGIDFKVKDWTRGDETVKVQLWDTAGQEKYQSITKAYFRGAHGFVLTFDLTSKESFEAVEGWYNDTTEGSGTDSKVVLVANKTDLTDERSVTTEEIQALADKLGIQFFETSVKDNINVKEAFEALLNKIVPPPAERPSAEETAAAEKPPAGIQPVQKPVDTEQPGHVDITAKHRQQKRKKCPC